MYEETYSYTETSASTASGLGVVVGGVAFIVLVLFVIWFLRKRNRAISARALGKTGLRVILPRPVTPQEERRDPKELIGVMEPVFASLSYFYEPNVFKRFWQGQPTFSFELVAHHGELYFYCVCPEEFIDQVERQIHAQYPNAHIEKASDYDVFLEPEGESAVGALGLMRSHIFPVRTYKNLESDPLNALSNALSRVGEGKAAIQFLVQPTDQIWQHRTEEALHNIQQGKTFHHNSTLGAKVASLGKEVGKSLKSAPQEEEARNDAMNTAKQNVRLTALQEQQAKQLAEKGSKVGFKVQIRIVAREESQINAKNQVQTMLSAFSQFQAPESNGFKVSHLEDRALLADYVFRSFSKRQPTMILNTEELASLFHLPNVHIETPNIHWLGSRRFAPPTNVPKSGVLLGFNLHRGQRTEVFMNYSDRMRHLYMIGKTGVGKTNLFENMVVQDIRNGHGICYMDPNGDAVEWILRHIPKERAQDVILFDPSDTARPLALNLLEYDANFPEQKTMIINEMISIFDKLYDLRQTGGPIFEQYMRNAMLLVMEDPASGSTLMEISKVLADPEFRHMKLSKTNNQVVHDFWVKEAEKAGGEAALANVVPYVTSKLTQFTSNDIMRPIIGQQTSAFNFREVMDSRKILLVTLPKGLLGDINAKLLGMIISGKLQMAAFSRQNIPEETRVPFYLYVDEFQNFTSKTFATILSEARKYALSLNITHQFLEQLDEEMLGSVLGNVGTTIAWRVGAKDAEVLIKEMEPLSVDDMVSTEKYNFYMRTLIDGAPTTTFNVETYPPDPHESKEIGEAIRQLSRLTYGRDRNQVEEEIRLRSKSVLV